MNVAGGVAYEPYVCAEIIDPSYRQLTLPTPLLAVRSILFGAGPDRVMLAYRVRQLLAVAHATPLSEYLLSLDPRITYDFSDQTAVLGDTWRTGVTAVTGNASTLALYGTPEIPDVSGRAEQRILLRVDTDGIAGLTRLTPPLSKVDIEVQPGIAAQLLGTPLMFWLANVLAPQVYIVTILARPTMDLSGLMASVASLSEPIQNYLFGITDDEPFLTFRNIWQQQNALPLRVAALVCALAYCTEAIRTGAASSNG
jgi:hypothetical protein